MRAVVKANKITREVEATYPSAVKAAEGEGMRGKRMEDICRNRTLPCGMYYYRYLDKFDPDENFEGLRNCPVVLVDTVNHQHLWYGDRKDCAQKGYWSINYLSTVISAGSHLLNNRYRPMYVTKRVPAASCS